MNGTVTPLHKKCTQLNKQGSPCRSTSVGADGLCRAHRIALGKQEKPVGFGGPQPNSGRPRKPSMTQRIQEIIEPHAPSIFGVMIRNLKDPDPYVQLKAAGMLADRLYGRPRQAIELTGEVDHHLVEMGRASVEDADVQRLTDDIRSRLVLLDTGDVR